MEEQELLVVHSDGSEITAKPVRGANSTTLTYNACLEYGYKTKIDLPWFIKFPQINAEKFSPQCGLIDAIDKTSDEEVAILQVSTVDRRNLPRILQNDELRTLVFFAYLIPYDLRYKSVCTYYTVDPLQYYLVFPHHEKIFKILEPLWTEGKPSEVKDLVNTIEHIKRENQDAISTRNLNAISEYFKENSRMCATIREPGFRLLRRLLDSLTVKLPVAIPSLQSCCLTLIESCLPSVDSISSINGLIPPNLYNMLLAKAQFINQHSIA